MSTTPSSIGYGDLLVQILLEANMHHAGSAPPLSLESNLRHAVHVLNRQVRQERLSLKLRLQELCTDPNGQVTTAMASRLEVANRETNAMTYHLLRRLIEAGLYRLRCNAPSQLTFQVVSDHRLVHGCFESIAQFWLLKAAVELDS